MRNFKKFGAILAITAGLVFVGATAANAEEVGSSQSIAEDQQATTVSTGSDPATSTAGSSVTQEPSDSTPTDSTGTATAVSTAPVIEQPVVERKIGTVIWEITSPADDVFLTPQVYVKEIDTDNVHNWDTDASLKCGTKYQVDAYYQDVIPGLKADGLLKGGEDGGIALHWYVFTTPACVPVEPPVVTPPVVTPPVTEPPVVTPPVVGVPETVQAAVVVPNVVSKPDTLAMTGASDKTQIFGAIGAGLLGFGVLALLLKRRRA